MKIRKYNFETAIEKTRRVVRQAPPPARLKLGTLFIMTAETAREYMKK